MTQILNNIKRKEKKGLFYLIGIAIMVAIMGISCSAKATAPADFSETEDFVEVKNEFVSEFVNVEDATHKIRIELRQNPTINNGKVMWGVSTTGEKYQFHVSWDRREYPITHDGKNGRALFEDDYLKIWFNDNQSDLMTFKKLEK